MSQKFIYHSLSKARNGEHYEYHNVSVRYLTTEIVELLGLGKLYSNFIELFNKEKTIYTTIHKFEETSKLQELDRQRDETYCFIVQDIKNKLRSPDQYQKEIAKNINLILTTHSNAESETQAGETGTLSALIEDLKEHHYADLQNLGLAYALDKLDEFNSKFEDLLLSRNDESLRRKTLSNMVNVRKEIDKTYVELINALNGLWIVFNMNAEAEKEKIAVLDELAGHLNSYAIETFNNLTERRKRNSDN